MEFEEGQPASHEIGSRSFIVAPVEPLDVDGIRTVQIGLVLWLVGFLVLLPFYDRLQDNGTGWWLWTCAAGFVLGLGGLENCYRRKRARARRRSQQARD